jgi:hypothetical protein
MLRLSDQFKERRGKWLCDEIQSAIEDRKPLDAKLELVRALFWMDKDPGAVPWEGASDVHLPVLYEKIETNVPKLVNAFWGTEPIVHVSRVPDEYMPEETDHAEQLLNWGLEQDVYPNFYQTSEDWFRNALRDGVSTVKSYWRREWEKTVEVHRIKGAYQKGETSVLQQPVPEYRAKTVDEVLYEIFGKPTDKHGLVEATEIPSEPIEGSEFPELAGLTFEVEFVEGRRRMNGVARILPGEYVDEIEVHVYRRVLKHDGPCVEVVEHEDLIVPFRTVSLQDADWVAQQFWLNKRDIEAKARSGEWDINEEDLDKLMKLGKIRQDEIEDNKDLKRQKDRITGEGVVDQIFTSAAEDGTGELDDSTDFNKLLFFEVYVKDDVDDDDDPIEVIYTISHDLRKIVKAQYLSMVFPHNRRPFASLKYKNISDRWYAQGMGEILVAINLEVNTIVNYVNNNQELINNPFFFYVPAVTMTDPAVLKGVAPGDGVPIGDVNGVMFPRFQQQPLANLSAMDTLLLFADRITISPMAAGSPQVRNAPRTARGTLALLGEGNVQMDNIVTRWQRTGWEELMQQLIALYGDFLPDEKWIYVTGADGTNMPLRVRPAELRGRYLFSFTGNTVNTNREVLRGIAQVRYNTVMTHPDYAQDPNVRREALKDFLRHFSEGVDISRLVPAMPGESGYTHPKMSQQSENMAMLNGLEIDVLPSDDHAGHLQILEKFRMSQAFETMPEERVILFANHYTQHQQYMSQQMQQGQQPMSPGQGNNVPQGMTQNPGTDLNALEGGVQ